jgi:hypothetical protein
MATPSLLLVKKNRARMLTLDKSADARRSLRLRRLRDDAAGGGEEYDEDIKNKAIPLAERHGCLDRPPLPSPRIAVPVSFRPAPPPR